MSHSVHVSPFLLLLCLALPGTSIGAPISVAYQVSGGDTSGGLLDNAPISSGLLVVTLPNPGSGSPPLTTFAPSMYVRLTGTNGQQFVRLFTPGSFQSATAVYGPSQVNRFNWSYRTLFTYFDETRALFLSASTAGNILNGRWFSGRFGYYTVPGGTAYVCCARFGPGFRNLTGQEVRSLPEPHAAPVLLLACLAGVARLAATGSLARHRRRGR